METKIQKWGNSIGIRIPSSILKDLKYYELKKCKKIKGSVLCELIRSVNYEARDLKFIEKCEDEDYDNILDIINSFVE